MVPANWHRQRSPYPSKALVGKSGGCARSAGWCCRDGRRSLTYTNSKKCKGVERFASCHAVRCGFHSSRIAVTPSGSCPPLYSARRFFHFRKSVMV